MKLLFGLSLACLALLTALACTGSGEVFRKAALKGVSPASQQKVFVKDSVIRKLCDAAITQTKKNVTYDGSYFRIPYPGGDIPDSLGVCTDVIIRAYRKIGYDLQKLVHEDMKRAFGEYEKRRKNGRIDPNIDHRRCPNLETFFGRYGKKLPVTDIHADYKPGDIVFWDVAAGHVGMVVHAYENDSAKLMVVHNIGSGPRLENYLFKSKITGHYRYTPWRK